MPTVKLYNQKHETLSEIELQQDIFGVEVKEHLFEIAVRYQRAKKRAGTHAVKSRAQVSGGGKKPFKQKGTGRARAGTTRAVQWRGGGVVHGPIVHNHAIKLPKKVRAAALKSALSKRVSEEHFWALDEIKLSVIKTKRFIEIMDAFSWNNVLIVIPEQDENLLRSARNIPGVTIIRPEGLNVYDVLKHQHVALTLDAIERVNARLGR